MPGRRQHNAAVGLPHRGRGAARHRFARHHPPSGCELAVVFDNDCWRHRYASPRKEESRQRRRQDPP